MSPSPLPPPSAPPFDMDAWLSAEETAPEGGRVQAAQVGVGSSSPLHYQPAPPFDMDAWLTSVGLEPDR